MYLLSNKTFSAFIKTYQLLIFLFLFIVIGRLGKLLINNFHQPIINSWGLTPLSLFALYAYIQYRNAISMLTCVTAILLLMLLSGFFISLDTRFTFTVASYTVWWNIYYYIYSFWNVCIVFAFVLWSMILYSPTAECHTYSNGLIQRVDYKV